MRKLIAIAVVGIFLVVPTAVVTAGQNWSEISKTLGEISKTLNNISTLIGQGELEDEDLDKMSLSQLVLRSGIPVGLMTALEATPEVKSAQYNLDADINTRATANRRSAEMSVGLNLGGTFDLESKSNSSEFGIKIGADRNFSEIMFNDDVAEQVSGMTDFEFAVSAVTTNGVNYFRLDRGGDFGLFDLSDFRNQWLHVDTSGFEGFEEFESALEEAGNTWESKEKRDEETKNFLKAYIKYPIFEFTKLSDSMVGGKWHTAYRVDLRNENVLNFSEALNVVSGKAYKPLSSKERADAERILGGLKASATIVYDSEIRKVTSDINLDINVKDFDNEAGPLNPDLERQTVDINLEFNLSNVNESQRFNEPRRSTPLEDVIEDILGRVFGGLFDGGAMRLQ